MKRRLGLWKECRRTSAGGQPRAIPLSLSLASRTLLPPPPSGGNREYSITPSPSSPLSSMAASSSILQLILLSAHIPLGHVRVHAIVVVTDTSRGLTCHTRSAVHLPSTADRPPTTPLLHPSFGPPGCIGTPAAIAVGRHRWCTGPLTSSIHSYRPLLSHRERISRALFPLSFSFLFFLVSRVAALLCPPCVASHSPVFLHSRSPPVRTKPRRTHPRPCTPRCYVCYCLRLPCYRYAITHRHQHRARVSSQIVPWPRVASTMKHARTRFDRLVSRFYVSCARRCRTSLCPLWRTVSTVAVVERMGRNRGS